MEEELYEEFDISTFDFTIRDPGEDPLPPAEEPAAEPVKVEEAPSPKKERKKPREEEEEEPAPGEEVRTAFGLPNFAAMDRRAWRNKLRRYLRYALRPSGLYENMSERLWAFFLGGNCLFMALFYLLVGLDWLHADLISGGRLVAFVLTGGLLGGAAALSFVGLTALTARLCREDAIRPFRLLSSVAGAWLFPAASLLFGLLLSFFGLSVSMSFGIMALLWWIYTLTEVLRDLLGKRYFSILTLIVLWGVALMSVISVTFRLK